MKVLHREHDWPSSHVWQFPVLLLKFSRKRGGPLYRHILGKIVVSGRWVSRNKRLCYQIAHTRRTDRHSLNKYVLVQPFTRKVRRRVGPIKCKTLLGQQSEKIEFPKTRVECTTLKLLNEVSINILIVIHHRFNQRTGRRKPFARGEAKKSWVELFRTDYWSEEIHGLPSFVILIKTFGRPLRPLFHAQK